MKQKNILKRIHYVSLIVFVGFMFYLNPIDQDQPMDKIGSAGIKDTSFIPHEKSAEKSLKQHRSPASVPTKRLRPQLAGREIIGPYHSGMELKFINSPNQKWKEIYTKRYINTIGTNLSKNLKVEHKKSLIKVHFDQGRYLEHIVVSNVDEKGNPFSFEALIDSETGTMVRSWNKTRYEFNRSPKIDTRGNAVR